MRPISLAGKATFEDKIVDQSLFWRSLGWVIPQDFQVVCKVLVFFVVGQTHSIFRHYGAALMAYIYFFEQ
jgi:hypothetical protein